VTVAVVLAMIVTVVVVTRAAVVVPVLVGTVGAVGFVNVTAGFAASRQGGLGIVEEALTHAGSTAQQPTRDLSSRSDGPVPSL
jgi:hypothetical protein